MMMTAKQGMRLEKLLRHQVLQAHIQFVQLAGIGTILARDREADAKVTNLLNVTGKLVATLYQRLNTLFAELDQSAKAEEVENAQAESAASADVEKFEEEQEKSAERDAELLEYLKKMSIPE